MTSTSSAISIQPEMEFPQDLSLPDLPRLFDAEWVWQRYRGEYGEQEFLPQRILVEAVSHTQGREAVVTYEVEWPEDAFFPNERFTLHLERDKPLRISRFPDDDYLPGLGEACDPESAWRLLRKHVVSIPTRRMQVQVIRYRPRSHAVLRHRMGRSRLYVRVVRPSAVQPILQSGELIGRSDFTVPRLAGLWRDGGVLWFSEIPGKNLRTQIRKGEYPPPRLILDRLESLWAVPVDASNAPPFNLPGAYLRARQIIEHSVQEGDCGWTQFTSAVEVLDRFVETWQATSTAHNDFYDDQMVLLPDGKIALVDIEGAGPGDPMLDVGNFLAHLRWSSDVSRRGTAYGEYHAAFRREANERFRWAEAELDLREAVCLFRICTNAIRHPTENSRERLQAGLTLVATTLP